MNLRCWWRQDDHHEPSATKSNAFEANLKRIDTKNRTLLNQDSDRFKGEHSEGKEKKHLAITLPALFERGKKEVSNRT